MDEIKRFCVTLQILLWFAVFVGIFNIVYATWSVIRLQQCQQVITKIQGK